MKEFSKKPEELDIYAALLGDIFLAVISNPQKLKLIFEMEKQGLSHTEIAYKMRQIW